MESETAFSTWAVHLLFCVLQLKVLKLCKPNLLQGRKLACVHLYAAFIFTVLREILFAARMKDFYFSGTYNPSLSRLADVLLVVSPAVPPCCYGQVLAVCERRGFGLMGLQRLQLQSNGAALLRLTNQQVLLKHDIISQRSTFLDAVLQYYHIILSCRSVFCFPAGFKVCVYFS